MTESMNHVELSGRLGRDPELKYLASGGAMARTSIALTAYVPVGTREDRQFREQTDWINLVAWGKLAERMAEECRQGSEVELYGRLSARSWQDDAGVKHYATEVVVRGFEVKGQPQRRAPQPAAAQSQPRGDPRWEGTYTAGQGIDFAALAAKPEGSTDPDDLPFE